MGGIAVAGRVVASAGIVGGAAAFLLSFGPGLGTAEADIYGPLARAAGFMATPGTSQRELVTGTVRVNGQPFHYAAGNSKWSVDQVLENYQRQFRIATSTGQRLDMGARMETRDAGVVSGFRFEPLQRPEELEARFHRFLKTTNLGDLGAFHMVAAFRGDRTSFIEFSAGEGVRLNALVPTEGQDAPGTDLAGVARPSQLQRLMTLEHGEGPAWSRTIVYRARDGRPYADAYRSALRAAGWDVDPLLDNEAVGHFTDGQNEVFVGGAAGDGDALVIVVHRKNVLMRLTR